MIQEQIRVVHIDDEPDFTDLSATFLEREDDRFSVETATSAADGLGLINDRPPDCVVSDYNMPGMDGLELLQAVREEYPDLSFILFTGRGSEAVASDAIAAGVTDYLQKGSGTEQYELLANRIRNAVRARREAEWADRQQTLMRLTELTADAGGFEMDTETGEVTLTDGADRILDLPDDLDLTVETGLEQFHPEDRTEIRQAVDRATETSEQTHGTWRYTGGDGEQRLLDVTFKPATSNGDTTTLRGAIHDVTDRRERQRDLEQTETLFEHAQDSLFLIDVGEEFTIERVNPAWEDTTGLSADGVRGQTPLDVLGEQPGATAETKYRECIQRQEPLQYEETARFDGEITHWETQIAPVFVDGSVEYIAGSTRDVTEQKEQDQELRRNKRAMDEAPVGITLSDPSQDDNPLTYVNDQFEEVTGYDEDETVGRNCRWLQGDDTREEPVAQMREAIDAQDPVTVELRNYRKDGTGFWNRVSIAPVRDDEGSVTNFVGFQEDITKRKQREQELERTTDLMSNMEQLADVGAWEYDSETDTLMLTDGARRIHGADPSADLSVEAAFETFHPEDRDRLEERFRNCLETGEPYEIDVRLTSPDGDQRWVTARGERLTDGSGNVVRGYIQNITDQIERVRKLKRQNERLDEFVSFVSHDLRSPLNRASLGVELAQQASENPNLDDVRRGIDRSLALIDDLITLAREGEVIGPTEPVEFEEVVSDAWEMVETADATLSLEADVTIQADRSRLRQLLVNLLQNAIDHAGADVVVTVDDTENGFAVEDDGPGIPDSDREDVFDAGYSTAESGTGFGLRIVEQVASGHGWSVSVTDGEDDGARFEITGVDSSEHTGLR